MTTLTPVDIRAGDVQPTDRITGQVIRNITSRVPFDVPGYELPVLVTLHGADNILIDPLTGERHPKAQDDPNEQWYALVRKYSSKSGEEALQATYSNGANDLLDDSPRRKSKRALKAEKNEE